MEIRRWSCQYTYTVGSGLYCDRPPVGAHGYDDTYRCRNAVNLVVLALSSGAAGEEVVDFDAQSVASPVFNRKQHANAVAARIPTIVLSCIHFAALEMRLVWLNMEGKKWTPA